MNKNKMDVREACCLETAGVGKELKSLKSDTIIEIVLNKSMQEMMQKIAKEENCEILETKKENEKSIRVKVRKKSVEEKPEKKKENCMVCGSALEYLTEAVSVICNYCGKKESGYIKCPKGHYVCEECHGKGAYELIKDAALKTKEKDPLAIAETMMSHPNIPMLGCEHAYITVAAFMAALKNTGSDIKDKQIIEAMERVKKQAVSGYCGLTGVCGVPIAIGAVFSIILKAGCPKDTETSITMHAVARTVNAIANDTGPCCCKSYVRTALGIAFSLSKEFLKVELPIHRERISCFYSKRHPHGCRAEKCSYFPKV